MKLTRVIAAAFTAMLLLAGCPDTRTEKEKTATCEAAQKQAADDPGNPVKAQRVREACR